MMDWINPLYGWLGLGGVAVAGALAIAWFFPPFRKLALTIAGVAAAAMALYTKGSRDASKREREKNAAAERAMLERGRKARADADAAVRSGGVRGRDKRDRDDI